MNTRDDAPVALSAGGRRPVRRRRADERRARGLRRDLRALAIGLVLGGWLLAGPATAPPGVAAVGPLPACRIADIATVPSDYDSWSTTLVDWLLTVGKDYVPPDLVSVQEAGIAGSGLIRKVAIDDLAAMAKAAAEAGTPIAVEVSSELRVKTTSTVAAVGG